MLRGEPYYFFRLDKSKDDTSPMYLIAKSFDDLVLRHGQSYIDSFYEVTQLNEVTLEHIRAIDRFIYQQIS